MNDLLHCLIDFVCGVVAGIAFMMLFPKLRPKWM